jgi:hypothetical protein
MGVAVAMPKASGNSGPSCVWQALQRQCSLAGVSSAGQVPVDRGLASTYLWPLCQHSVEVVWCGFEAALGWHEQLTPRSR